VPITWTVTARITAPVRPFDIAGDEQVRDAAEARDAGQYHGRVGRPACRMSVLHKAFDCISGHAGDARPDPNQIDGDGRDPSRWRSLPPSRCSSNQSGSGDTEHGGDSNLHRSRLILLQHRGNTHRAS
jgi:hypothetical protein